MFWLGTFAFTALSGVSLAVTRFIGAGGGVQKLRCVHVSRAPVALFCRVLCSERTRMRPRVTQYCRSRACARVGAGTSELLTHGMLGIPRQAQLPDRGVGVVLHVAHVGHHLPGADQPAHLA